MMNLGVFLSTYYLQAFQAITGDAIYQPLLMAVGVFMALGIIFLIYNPFSQKLKAEPES